MKTAIITGASSGIGREFVQQISAKARGIDELWVIARRENRLVQLQKELKIPVRIFIYDLALPQSIADFKLQLTTLKPDVTLLVNCAGYGKFGSYAEISDEQALGMIDLNCRALVAMTSAVLPYMKRGASILQMASTSSFQPLPDMAVYAAGKAFVVSYSRALHAELKPRGITCTAVCAGWMKTEFFETAKSTANPQAVNNFAFIQDPAEVVAKALRDTCRHKDISVCGGFNKLHRLTAKLLPNRLVMSVWMKAKQKER
ncbi:SDR family NAD(P)-dependent oxidoreductase [Hydrogenoanaerobacterium sp.]|uniref:SDR family NAD(P)-dependent oxidoreductase n=1 Tax=Hydrogenoanaerobacterium sp. TaxID=2953763 RepID=UPI0028974C03|nr:SDR family NAD(P)-dependent oxidoreductase [Hydrogenoanaerobacterium sp.]